MDCRSVITLLTLLLLVGILIGVWRSLSNVGVLSPPAVTRAHMAFLRSELLQFASTRPLLTSLDELPPSAHPALRDDAWHRPILYRLNPDGSATLTSLGADNAPGAPGGTGDNADITLNIPAPPSRPTTSP
jgi:hypothetical protein